MDNIDYGFLIPTKSKKNNEQKGIDYGFLNPVQRAERPRNTFSEVQRVRNLPTISDFPTIKPSNTITTTKYQTVLSPAEVARMNQLQKSNSLSLLHSSKEQQELNDLLAKQKSVQDEAAR
jgi:hypothetical protein